MIGPRVRIVAAGVMLAMGVVVCGKRGNPLAPLRPVPAAVGAFAVERADQSVTIQFTVPAANTDGSTPAAVEKVEVFAVSLPATAPPPTNAQLFVQANLVSSVAVRAAETDPAAAPDAKPDARPAPGELATVVDTLAVPADANAAIVRYYSAVPSSGRRRGPPAPILRVQLSTAPAPPTETKADYTEQTLTLSWQAAGAGQRFVVEEVTDKAALTRLSAPLENPRFELPVQFGVARCFVVRAVDARDGVTIVGAPTTPVCVTPVDRFAPPAPTGLLAVPVEAAVDLTWTAVTSRDLAGYIVLRGDEASGTLQPLTAAPITAATYRDESVRSGVTYVYAVIAIDNATPPNQSAESSRQVVTARQPQAR